MGFGVYCVSILLLLPFVVLFWICLRLACWVDCCLCYCVATFVGGCSLRGAVCYLVVWCGLFCRLWWGRLLWFGLDGCVLAGCLFPLGCVVLVLVIWISMFWRFLLVWMVCVCD